jgi:hypothetical protein
LCVIRYSEKLDNGWLLGPQKVDIFVLPDAGFPVDRTQSPPSSPIRRDFPLLD